MALQSDALMLLGLGLKAEAAHDLQPAIEDGIHLRWSFNPSRGFPFYGFYVFRRKSPTITDTPTLYSIITSRNLQYNTPFGTSYALDSGPLGTISSDVNLALRFHLQEIPGFTLQDRQSVVLSFRKLVCTAKLEINFSSAGSVVVSAYDGDVLVATKTLQATGSSMQSILLQADRITSVALSSGPAIVSNCTVCSVETRAGTAAETGAWQKAPGFSYPLMLPITHANYSPSSSGGTESYSSSRSTGLGRVLYNKARWPSTTPTVLTSAGTVSLVQNSPLVVGSGTNWGQDLLGETFAPNNHDSVYTIAQVVDATHLVLSRAYTGQTDPGWTYKINRDTFGQLYNYLYPLVAGGPAAPMGDVSLPAEASPLASVTVLRGSVTVDGAGTAWDSRMVGLALYVSSPRAGTVTLHQNSRSVYGAGTAWNQSMVGMLFRPSTHTEFYVIEEVLGPDLLVLERPYLKESTSASYTVVENTHYRVASVSSATKLQLDRPYAGSATSASAFFFPNLQAGAGDRAAVMERQRVLDYLLLGSLDPAIAQMLGLYWVDRSVTSGAVETYDYLLVADYTNVANRSPETMLGLVNSASWSQIQASITIGKRYEVAPALAAPSQPSAYVLPAPVATAPGNVGVRWNIEQTGAGRLLPGRPVFYHLWRAPLAASAPTTPPDAPLDSAYTALTQTRPVLVAENEGTPGTSVDRPPDWPPYQLYAFDRGLAEGWYSYAVSGVDIFGRHSLRTTARWMQWVWNPPAELGLAKPWYFNGTEGEHAVHEGKSYAVCILSKVTPPVPAAVEAFLLDPADLYVVKDDPYTTWRTANPDAVGLRVRWRWTQRHALQAPDTSEFRIYYHSGPNPPARVSGQHSAYPWQCRLYAQPYASYKQQTTVSTADGTMWVRTYDVILNLTALIAPPPPDSRTPILYAHVGVTAADSKSHTADGYTRDGRVSKTNPAARKGNESAVSSPARIFRVRRGNTDAVAVPPEGDAVYATPADYHGVSRYTYRWTAPTLAAGERRFVQVFRALDETVFMVDWAQRPRSTMAGSRIELFPPEWRGADAAAKRDSIAAKLNHLNTLTGNPAAAFAYYRSLAGDSNDTLRVLAGLPGNERAFTLLTAAPVLAAAGSYVDTLDGRADSRYFYRARFLDAANNPGPFTHSSPPVWMPDIQPPRTPAGARALGGDRQITLGWASNREPDLKEYRVYRTDSAEGARDLRLMTLVQTVAVPAGDPTARPAEVSWVDSNVPGLVNRYYRIAAVDTSDNSSEPSAAVSARAFDEALPTPPALTVVWTNATPAAARASWTTTEESLLERRSILTVVWYPVTDWQPPGAHTIDDQVASDYTWFYRVRVRKATKATVTGQSITLRRIGE